MLDELKTAERVVGIKQLRKALTAQRVQTVYVARDADPMLTEPLLEQCEQAQVTDVYVATMQKLGIACGIPVPAAAAATIRSPESGASD